MGVAQTKWTRQPGQRPQQIMAAALDVFSEKGFERATMEEIAKASGVTKGTIYLYFQNKEELFIQTLRAHVQEVLTLLPTFSFSTGDSMESQVRTLSQAVLRVLMTPAMTKVFPLFIAEVKRIPALRQAYIEEWLPRVSFHLASVLEAGVEAGVFRPHNSGIAARAVLGMFSVFVMTQEVFGVKEITPMPIEAIADTVTTIFFRGVLAS